MLPLALRMCKSSVMLLLSLLIIFGVNYGIAFAENSDATKVVVKDDAPAQSLAELNAEDDALEGAFSSEGLLIEESAGLSEEDEASLANADSSLRAAENDQVKQPSVEYDLFLSGIYIVRSSLSGTRALDVSGASFDSGANVQVWAENSTPAQRYLFVLGDDGFYTIENVNSGKYLDVSGARNQLGANVQQYEGNGSDAQKWAVVINEDGSYSFESKLKTSDGVSLVLDISGANESNGANVQLYSSNDTNAQKWTLNAVTPAVDDGVYSLVTGLSTNQVLDISGASVNFGANAQIYASNNSMAQRFQFKYQEESGYYQILNTASGMALDAASAGSTNGTNVQQYAWNGSNAQKWALSLNEEGSLSIASAVSGLALDVSAGRSVSGTNVQLWESNGTLAQSWAVSAKDLVQDGVYAFACTANDNYVLDISGASVAEDGNLQIWQVNGSNAQKFAITNYSGAYYTIRNINSGLLVGLAGGASGSGVNVGQGYAGVADSQLWTPELTKGGLVWRSKSGFALDVAAARMSSGTNVQAWSANGTSAQKFKLVSTAPVFSEGVYVIASALDARQVLDIPSASVDSGVQPQLYQANGTAAQKFFISSTGDGCYRIVSMNSNKSLDVKDFAIDESDGSGTVQQWATSNNDAQKWSIEVTDDGYFTFVSKCGSGRSALDVTGGIASNGSTVQVYGENGLAAQKFILQPATSSIAYRPMNMSLAEQASYQLTEFHSYDEYYQAMNPSNVSSLTVFADVRGYSGLSADQLNSYIASTYSGRSGTLAGMGYAFVAAARDQGLSEAYVLCHALLESGWGTSELSSGYYYGGGWIDGAYYNAGTYYNYFGIGAYDSSALSGGRKYAIINGWNSPEAAIKGGAAWIARNYTYASSYPQFSLYDMRYDTARSNASLARGWHQYATSLTWANSIATLIDRCYSTAGASAGWSYLIPGYR